MKSNKCPVCKSSNTRLFLEVKEYTYFKCKTCDVIFIDPEVLNKIDGGAGLTDYSQSYWAEELRSAKERSWGVALARVAELFLYARLPINKFIDIGSGPGYLLDSLAFQLPSSTHIFYGHELFPPADEFCTTNPNYIRGGFKDLDFSFDAGCCIEVVEHLTPKMVEGLFSDLAFKSKRNSIYIFNTGLVEYIEKEDIKYLDPYMRGHIMGWSIKGLQHLLSPLGFKVFPIPGKTWAFVAEYQPDHDFQKVITERMWSALPQNIRTLSDEKTGNLLYVLALDTARAYR